MSKRCEDKCTCGYEKFFYQFSGRLHEAKKPAVKMYAVEIKEKN